MHTDPNIELRNEEVQELMGKIPPVILRMGITILLIFVVLIYAVSRFVKYPDVITLPIIAKNVNCMREIRIVSSGRLIDCGIDNNHVSIGDTLAKIAVNEAASQDTTYIISPIAGISLPCDTYHATDYVEKNAILCVIVDSIMNRVIAKSYIKTNQKRDIVNGMSVETEIDGIILHGNVQSVSNFANPQNNTYALTIAFGIPEGLEKTVIWNARLNAKMNVTEKSVFDRVFKRDLFH